MKIAVYAIAKNEEAHVERFVRSCQGADFVTVMDTGSTDRTLELLQEMGVHAWRNTTINPWRFDVARNHSLYVVPEDYDVCICLDLDEVLVPGWRDVIEGAWLPIAHRLRYEYVWSWNEDGTPAVTYHADKIHRRNGCLWRHPVHEVLTFGGPELHLWYDRVLIEHHPDPNKSRAQYLPLLRLAAKETPDDDRIAHYLGRELFFQGLNVEAISELARHLALPAATWNVERSASLRYMGLAYEKLGCHENAEFCFREAIDEAPDQREPRVDFARFLRDQGRRGEACYQAARALEIRARPKSYINWGPAWSGLPEQILQECARGAP